MISSVPSDAQCLSWPVDFLPSLFSLQLVGLLLIGVAAWGKGFGLVSSIHIIGGVIAVGVFLLLIAIVGLIGAIHHHQVMLFFVSFPLVDIDARLIIDSIAAKCDLKMWLLCFYSIVFSPVVSLTPCSKYMVILFIVFLFQFGVSCSCLAMNRGQQVKNIFFFCSFNIS